MYTTPGPNASTRAAGGCIPPFVHTCSGGMRSALNPTEQPLHPWMRSALNPTEQSRYSGWFWVPTYQDPETIYLQYRGTGSGALLAAECVAGFISRCSLMRGGAW